MKKLVSLVVAIAVLASNVSFAQYGGGGASYSSNNAGGYTSFALVRDLCSNGDRSPSYFDGTCGWAFGNELLVTGPTAVKIVKKKRRISFTRLLKQVPVIENLFR